jgi:hypothetical protein
MLPHLDDNVLRQIDYNMVDCAMALEGLERLLKDVQNSKVSRNIFRKPTLHIRISLHKEDFSNYEKKIYKSNCALQTAIALVNMSVVYHSLAALETF